MGIHRQEDTDFSVPEERFLWAFQNISYNGFPFLAPESVFREWSRHLSDCGFVHVSQVRDGVDLSEFAQRIHFQPPLRGQDHAFNGAGEWIPVEEPVRESFVPVVEQLTASEKAQLIDDLRREGSID